MGGVVAATVAEVDTADERAVELRTTGVAQDDELLMMGSPGTDPHVEQTRASAGRAISAPSCRFSFC